MTGFIAICRKQGKFLFYWIWREKIWAFEESVLITLFEFNSVINIETLGEKIYKFCKYFEECFKSFLKAYLSFYSKHLLFKFFFCKKAFQ